MIVLEICEDAELAAGGEHLCNDNLFSLLDLELLSKFDSTEMNTADTVKNTTCTEALPRSSYDDSIGEPF